ncbi:MAG: bifunctional aspartate kinase/homoserine dehydrogenase I [Flavobacterium sp. BFFFF2]|nr:MAG: bifunctional aspartate kinase/homoserine dehydrogenase I [Flavobacterium sp. BFFFF2]
MIVLKFGGTSVANAENIEKVIPIIIDRAKDKKVAVVVSALSGVTDLLLLAAKLASGKQSMYLTTFEDIRRKHLDVIDALINPSNKTAVTENIEKELALLKTLLDGCFLLGELSPRTSDAIAGFGEWLSSQIIAVALYQKYPDSAFKDSRELIQTDDSFGKARVNFDQTNQRIRDFFATNENKIILLPGFIASSSNGHTTTLGRGGSDYTAAILAAGVHAAQLEIWTDVSGMFTAHPKLVKQARPIEIISYQEAMELSHFGAKVLFAPTIQPVLLQQIPTYIKNTFEPHEPGTLITNTPPLSTSAIKGISHIENIALLTLEGSGIVGVSGTSKRLFEVLHRQGINVIFITQASSEHSICIGIQSADAERAKMAVDQEFDKEIQLQSMDEALVENNLCIVAAVGENMKNHQGISGQMFSALGKNNVNIRAIAQGASERNISVVIHQRDVKKALNTLHERFFEDQNKQLNLFVMGVGNVGEKFIEQIHKQRKFLKETFKINVRIMGMANSKTMIFDEDGLSLSHWKEHLANGEPSSLAGFIERIQQLNVRNSTFVDNTANEVVAASYASLLSKSIAVVTCNKIACASGYDNYRSLKDLSRKYNAPFLFETNVGAGLPIIDTLKNLVASGDNVHQIQAVLSGSLNFIFNHFSPDYSFHDAVREAGVQGFTEPDPKIDLSGVDVARKILILIRESGFHIEMEDIENVSFLPQACLETTSNEAFFASLEAHAAHFEAILQQAKEQNARIKYVAEFNQGKAKVGLQMIPSDHPFYNLEGKDNIVLFYTDRYVQQPLIIKGAGAGADVTASGIFADIVRIGNY